MKPSCRAVNYGSNLRWRIRLIAGIGLLGLTSQPLWADEPTTPIMATSRSGVMGLLRLPNADLTPDGEGSLTGFSGFAPTKPYHLGDAEGYSINLGMLPQMEFAAQLNNPTGREDLAAGMKLQLLKEGSSRPALALGIVDFSSTFGDRTEYAAVSKLLLGRINATAGLIRRQKHTYYGGLEAGLTPYLTAVGEYDAQNFNYGLRAAVLHRYLRVGVSHFTRGWAFQAGVHFPFWSGPRSTAGVTLPESAQAPADALPAIQRALVQLGLENVSVGLPSDTVLAVAYENRSFPHSEMAALADVLAAASRYAPDGVDHLSVTVLRDTLPVLTMQTPIAGYRDYLAGTLDDDAYRAQLKVDYTTHRSPAITPAGAAARPKLRVAAPSPGHADLSVRPGVNTHLGSEDYILGAQVSVVPSLSIPLGHGLEGDASVSFSIDGPFGFRSSVGAPPSGFPMDSPHLEQLSGHWTVHPSPDLASRFFFGRYAGDLIGPFLQAAWLPGHGPLELEAEAGAVKHASHDDQSVTAVGEARYYIPKLDMEAVGTVGRYLDRDQGGTIGFLRRFGNTEVGADFLSTDISNTMLIRFGIPLGAGRLSNRPSVLRLRPTPYFDYEERSVVASGPNFLKQALATGARLTLEDSLENTWLDRNKLTPEYIGHNLPQLRMVDRRLREEK